MCAVCGEWMPGRALTKHMKEAHPGYMRELTRGVRMLLAFAIPAAAVLFLLADAGDLQGSWVGQPLVVWGWLAFAVPQVPIFLLARRPLSAYAETSYRCWVCDTHMPHSALTQHLRQTHPGERREFVLSEAMAAVLALSFPTCLVLPWVWRAVDPTMSLYLFLGPPAGAFSFAAALAVYASRWPRRLARSRTEWKATHPAG